MCSVAFAMGPFVAAAVGPAGSAAGGLQDELTLERVKEGYRNWILKDTEEYPSVLFDSKGPVAKLPKLDTPKDLDECINKVCL